ncbi:SLC13 family permease [Rhodoplanes sp. TEM]|nr:SLC13 family permease [Rhodoplanes sp. TEM]
MVAVGSAIALFPPAGLATADARAAALVIGAIGLWATGTISETLTVLLLFTLAMLMKVAPPQVVFAGLVSSSFWLVFAGLVIGAAIKQSGLGARIAAHLAAALSQTYRGAMVGVVLFGLAMAFLMPSGTGRVVLIIPILAALAEHLGYSKGSKEYIGLLLGGIFGTYLPSYAILPGNVPNNVMAGIVETMFGWPIPYGDYLLQHFPVLGLVKTGVIIVVLLRLYRNESGSPVRAAVRPTTPMSPAERRLAVLLAVALAFWALDSIHKISPAWVGMVAAVFCLLPRFGLLPPKALQTINLEPALFVGGIISLGALVAHAGLGRHLATWALSSLSLAPDHPVASFVQLSGLATMLGLLTTQPGIPAVLTPLTSTLASAGGLPTGAVLASQVVGFSTVILPYTAPPLVMAMQIADLPRREVTRVCLITAAVTFVVLWPLDVLWLTLLGRL